LAGPTRHRQPPADLKARLDRLQADYDHPDSAADPVQIVRRYHEVDDREVAAFLAAALAFGRVASVLASIERVLEPMGGHPGRFVRAFDLRRHRVPFETMGHRWIRGRDVIALIWILHEMLRVHGSIEACFAAGLDDSHVDIGSALDAFSARACSTGLDAVYGSSRGPRRVGYFFPRPSSGSGCKRLNLFLRWMVRRDRVDPGGWTSVRASKLIVPLDTHVIRVGRCLGLTRYVSPGWRMAAEITAALRTLDPDDPVKYDFALCHLGMMKACGFGRPRGDAGCPLKGLCHPSGSSRGARASSGRSS
jgi:uncharacterized protein (TIGR02757 family)